MTDKMTVNIPLDQLKDVVCECTNAAFVTAIRLRELPALYSPTGKADYLAQPLCFLCTACGKTLSMVPPPPDNVIDISQGRKDS
jgi:hypothetical protein